MCTSKNLRHLARTACLAALFCVCISQSAAADDRIKIGVPLPLSGEGANEGVDLKNLLIFANEKLASGSYDLVFEDDECSDKTSVSIAQKFVKVDGLRYVVGFSCSGTVLASAPVYERGGVLAIALATGAPGISQAGDFIFRTMPSLSTAAAKLYAHSIARYRNIAVLAEETGYGQEMAAALRKQQAPGKPALTVETYLPGTVDFRNIFRKLQVKGVEAIILIPQSEPGLILLVKQLLELKQKTALYTAFYAGYPLFLETFGSKADGIVFADLPFVEAALNRESAALLAEYKKSFGALQSSEFYFITTLGAFAALDEALRSGRPPKDYLYQTTFQRLFGSYRFDRNGDVQGANFTFVLKTIRDGKVLMAE